MSWELTRLVLSLRGLTPAEKAVAHSLAFHAPKHGAAYPSMETIALDAGLETRRTAQKIIRRLEAKHVIFPTTSKKGGRKNPTRYQFNAVNSVPLDALYLSGNSVRGGPNSGETASVEARNSVHMDARDSRDRKAVDSTSTSAAVSQEQMEREFLKVWNYYLEAFDKQEIISPSAKKKGLAILTELHRLGASAEEMAFAIDMARYIVKRNPKKAYLANWFTIFSKWDTFVGLQQQYREVENIPEAATWD